jgi:hypothetical protein
VPYDSHNEASSGNVISNDHSGVIAAAQVYAVIALAAATALDSDRREWFNVAGSKLSD